MRKSLRRARVRGKAVREAHVDKREKEIGKLLAELRDVSGKLLVRITVEIPTPGKATEVYIFEDGERLLSPGEL